MSTITDAVDKKKREEEQRKSKLVDLDNPPRVEMPRDWTGFRKKTVAFLVVFLIGTVAFLGYSNRERLIAFAQGLLPHPAKGGAPVVENDSGAAPAQPSGTVEKTDTGEEAPVKETAKPADEFPDLEITGVFHDPLEPEICINGTWYRTGEEVEGARIVEILRDSVRFKYNGRERSIRIR